VKLVPLLLKTPDLPSGEQGFQDSPVTQQDNRSYVQGRPTAESLAADLDKAGRIITLTSQWSKPGGQVTPSLKTPLNVIDSLALYQNEDGAKTGCPFVFSQVQPTVASPNGDVTKTAPLDVGAVGDDFKAYRIDYTYNALLGSPTPAPVRLQQVFYAACWRRGVYVAVVSMGALNEDPSLDDFKQVLMAQDQKLTSAPQ
jgi:hypothetical protein